MQTWLHRGRGGRRPADPAGLRRRRCGTGATGLSCFTCHGGANFSSREFHNTGLYNLPGLLPYPASDTGVHGVTGMAADIGKFKPPSLRNIAVTAPYMHDGSVATLEDAIDHYAAGGRTIADGPNRGVGHDNPNKSPAIRGFTITAAQRADLVAFLQSLTDDAVLHDARFGNPWPPGQTR